MKYTSIMNLSKRNNKKDYLESYVEELMSIIEAIDNCIKVATAFQQ